MMSAYETSTTVGGQGEIHLASVPFQPGTEVEVIINPKARGALQEADANGGLGALLAALDQAHNDEPIGAR